jgi:cysteinyl-tRNA synthetase
LTDESAKDQHHLTEGLMNLILDIRKEARMKKDFATSDQIRNTLQELKISVRDTKDGASWSLE